MMLDIQTSKTRPALKFMNNIIGSNMGQRHAYAKLGNVLASSDIESSPKMTIPVYSSIAYKTFHLKNQT